MNPPWVYPCSKSWTPLSPLLPYHRSGSSQCTSPKNPVSCIETRLAICFLYVFIHVSKAFFKIIPPSPSLTESKRLFYTSVSVLPSCIQGYHYHLSKFHIYALVYCTGVSALASFLPLRHKTECIWISSNEVDETGAYYIEWSKPERKTPIHTNAYMWNLERW